MALVSLETFKAFPPQKQNVKAPHLSFSSGKRRCFRASRELAASALLSKNDTASPSPLPPYSHVGPKANITLRLLAYFDMLIKHLFRIMVHVFSCVL